VSTHICPNCAGELEVVALHEAVLILRLYERFGSPGAPLPPDTGAFLCPHCAAMLQVDARTLEVAPLDSCNFPQGMVEALRGAQRAATLYLQRGLTKQ